MNISVSTYQRHLGRFGYDNPSLTYALIKELKLRETCGPGIPLIVATTTHHYDGSFFSMLAQPLQKCVKAYWSTEGGISSKKAPNHYMKWPTTVRYTIIAHTVNENCLYVLDGFRFGPKIGNGRLSEWHCKDGIWEQVRIIDRYNQ